VRPAAACSPPPPGVSSRFVKPRAGLDGVPTNARVVVEYDGEYLLSPPLLDLHLRPTGGADVALTVEDLGTASGRHVVVLTPVDPLQPATTYELLDGRRVPCDGSDCQLPAPVVIEAFTTGDGPDTTPPSFSGPIHLGSQHLASCESSACCGPYHLVAFGLSADRALDDDGENTLYTLAQEGPSAPRFPLAAQPSFVGANICDVGALADVTWLYGFFGGSGDYTITAVDLAGNETASPPLAVNVDCPSPWPSDAGPDAAADAAGNPGDGHGGDCGCRAGGRAHGQTAAAPLLVLIVVTVPTTRRRTPTAARRSCRSPGSASTPPRSARPRRTPPPR
jgi:hypothetical protein